MRSRLFHRCIPERSPTRATPDRRNRQSSGRSIPRAPRNRRDRAGASGMKTAGRHRVEAKFRHRAKMPGWHLSKARGHPRYRLTDETGRPVTKSPGSSEYGLTLDDIAELLPRARYKTTGRAAYKRRENKALYWAERVGMTLTKSGARNPRAPDYRRYRLVHANDGVTVAIPGRVGYCLSLDEVEARVAQCRK